MSERKRKFSSFMIEEGKILFQLLVTVTDEGLFRLLITVIDKGDPISVVRNSVSFCIRLKQFSATVPKHLKSRAFVMMRISRILTKKNNRSKFPWTIIVSSVMRIFTKIHIFENIKYLYTSRFKIIKSLPGKNIDKYYE